MKHKKVQLTRLERRKILNLYARKILSREEIKRTYGWTVSELSVNGPIRSEEHYLCKCPKCKSDRVAIYRNHTNVVVGATVVCKDCNTRVFSTKGYMDAMRRWNYEENIIFSH